MTFKVFKQLLVCITIILQLLQDVFIVKYKSYSDVIFLIITVCENIQDFTTKQE